MNICYIEGEYIQLNQLLKKENLVASGGEAKTVIENKLVKVNGQIASEIRKKLRHGDKVEFGGHQIQIKSEQ